MSTIRTRRRVTSLVGAIVMLLPVSVAIAQGPESLAKEGNRDRNRPVDVTFTKWRTTVLPPSGVATRFLFKGIVGGDLGAGDFVAEVLTRQASTPCTAFDPPCTPGITPPTITGSIAALHAIYEVQVGEYSFTALIQGGSNGVTGVGLLDGVILAGWRTGAQVHVEFQTIPAMPGVIACFDAAPGLPCFEGTIHVGRAPRD